MTTSPPTPPSSTRGSPRTPTRPCPRGARQSPREGPDGTVETARIFRLSDAAVYPWHARFEPFTLFYIDGASAVDSGDERWTLLTVTRESPNGADWRLLSFATVYEFYQYPDSTRARLSQIVVLPPYQRRGLGGKMLEAMRARRGEELCRSATVEDPTAQLQRIRDASDVRALTRRPSVMAEVRRCAMAAAGLKDGDDPAASKAALELPAAVTEEARENSRCARGRPVDAGRRYCTCSPRRAARRTIPRPRAPSPSSSFGDSRRCTAATRGETPGPSGVPDGSDALRGQNRTPRRGEGIRHDTRERGRRAGAGHGGGRRG